MAELMEKAAQAVTDKAAESAGGFAGKKAGEYAGEALEQWRPGIGERLRKSPGRSAVYALLALAVLAGAAYGLSRLAAER